MFTKWTGNVEGADSTKQWTGWAELLVEDVVVTGSIKWRSDQGHCGTESFKRRLDGEALILERTGTTKDGRDCKPLVRCDYRGKFTSQGEINFDWFPRSKTASKGSASGNLRAS